MSKKIHWNGKHLFLILFLLLIALYSLFEARFIILGPHIEIISPANGATVDSQTVTVTGIARNIAYISFNDRPIYIDEDGNWSEKLIASPGLSIITVRAKDRFGRETERSVEIVVQ